MMVLCFEKIDRGPYDTPKEGKGKEKDEGKRAISSKRELLNFKEMLRKWIEGNLPPKITVEDNMFIQRARQVVTTMYGSMSEKTKRRLNYVLDESIGRSCPNIFWMTLQSFVVMHGTKRSYKKRKTDGSNSDD
jgi:hypothetical protein